MITKKFINTIFLLLLVCPPVIGMGRRMSLFYSCYINKYQRRSYTIMEETLFFADDGFIAKLSKYFGNGKYLKFNRITFAKNLAKKQNLICKKIFYYVAPPFQSEPPLKNEIIKEGYDKFIKGLLNIMLTKKDFDEAPLKKEVRE